MTAAPRSCPRCRLELEVLPDDTGAFLERCPGCEGIVVEAAELERALRGRPPRRSTIDLPNPFATEASALICAICDRASLEPRPLATIDRGAFCCGACGAWFFESRAFVVVRREPTDDAERIEPPSVPLELDMDAMRPSLARAMRESAPVGAPPNERPLAEGSPMEAIRSAFTDEVRLGLSDDDGGDSLAHARFDHDDPWTRVAALPIAMGLGLVLAITEFGRLLGTPFRIQFHELGHAIAAYLSGRFALPIPCGLTVWSLEPSAAAHLVVILVATLFVLRGYHEKRRFPMALAAALELAHLLVATSDDPIAIVILAGGAAEMLLPAIAIVAFYFRMPDRLRWDFFRFLVLPFAAIAYLGAMRLWLSVLVGAEPAPMGSIVGTAGDGTGDLERLVHEHGIPLARIVRGYVTLGIASGGVILGVYAWFAIEAIRRLRTEESSAT